MQGAAEVPKGPSITIDSDPVTYDAGAAAASASAAVIQQLSAGDSNLDVVKRAPIELQTIEKRIQGTVQSSQTDLDPLL